MRVSIHRFIPNKVRAVCERAMKAKLEDRESEGLRANVNGGL